ncbi:MAG: hypothetical protein HOV80_18835, partial [Polyangiaceae bacterium]|nr:hypothetical protein [Polyangiaceae bacterium]
MKAPSGHTLRVALAVVALGCSSPSPATEHAASPNAGLPSPSNATQNANGVALELGVEQPDLEVGDVLKLSLAFRNASGERVRVIKPVDGSWAGARQPEYALEFSDEAGKPVADPFGYVDRAGCGLVNPLTAEDNLDLDAGEREAFDAKAWAPEVRVQRHARPGTVDVRVRYRADKLPGVAALNIVSNPVRLKLHGGDARLWACRNQQVAQATQFAYTNVTPVRLIEHASGYLLVAHGAKTERTPQKTDTVGDAFVQLLDAKGQPSGGPITIASSTDDWLGLVEALPVEGGVLVAFTRKSQQGQRDVEVVHVDTSVTPFAVSAPTKASTEPGEPFFLGLAKNGANVAIAWRGRAARSDVLRFRPLDTRGRPTGAAISIAASSGAPSTELLLEPSGAGFLIAWHQGGKELRLQRVGTDGTTAGSATTVMLGDVPNLMSMATLKGRLGLVYSDSGYRGDDPSDQMGLHEVALSPTDFRLVSDTPASPWDRSMARFGAATWVNDRLVRIYAEDKTLRLASGSGGKAPTEVLSKASGGTFVMWPSNDGRRALLTWSDER